MTQVEDERQRLTAEIVRLLHEEMSGTLFRIKVLAVVDGLEVPTNRRAFVALGLRAGASQAQVYKTWAQLRPDDADAASEADETALYHILGDADLLLYIGISKNFGERWKQHARKQPWWTERRRMTTEWYSSRAEAEEAETAAIQAEHPKHNIAKQARIEKTGDAA
jgi:predicted GIY-YIG superfamily endonuclease